MNDHLYYKPVEDKETVKYVIMNKKNEYYNGYKFVKNYEDYVTAVFDTLEDAENTLVCHLCNNGKTELKDCSIRKITTTVENDDAGFRMLDISALGLPDRMEGIITNHIPLIGSLLGMNINTTIIVLHYIANIVIKAYVGKYHFTYGHRGETIVEVEIPENNAKIVIHDYMNNKNIKTINGIKYTMFYNPIRDTTCEPLWLEE